MTDIDMFIVSMPREKVPESHLTALLAMEYSAVTLDGDSVAIYPTDHLYLRTGNTISTV